MAACGAWCSAQCCIIRSGRTRALHANAGAPGAAGRLQMRPHIFHCVPRGTMERMSGAGAGVRAALGMVFRWRWVDLLLVGLVLRNLRRKVCV